MELSKKKAVQLHRELWDWLYHHPSKKKEDWSGWKDNGGKHEHVSSDCFCCEYCEERCYACPLWWPPNEYSKRLCFDDGGLFYRWELALSPKTRKKYAKIIRDLPERK